MVMSVLLYGLETWAVHQQDLKRLHVFQMKCLQDIIGVTLWNKRRNEDTFGRSRRNTSGRPGETETTAMVWSPPKDASPSATATGAKMLTVSYLQLP